MGARVVMRIAAAGLSLCGVAPDAWAGGGPSTVARTDPPEAGPHAGTWALGVRYPWDVDSGSDGVVVGLGGLGLSVGVRVTDRVYAGAAAEAESMSRVTSATGEPADFERLRAGGELRAYVVDGQAWGSAPRHDWVGVRYGVESLDRGATFGRFADATLGTELALGAVGVSLSLSVGVSRDTPAAGAPAMTAALARVVRPAAPDETVTSPYVGFAIGLVIE